MNQYVLVNDKGLFALINRVQTHTKSDKPKIMGFGILNDAGLVAFEEADVLIKEYKNGTGSKLLYVPAVMTREVRLIT